MSTTLKFRLDARLAEIDETLAASADALQAVKLDQTSVGRLSRMDALQQQATRTTLREALLRERRRVLAALARLTEGRYGRCCACEMELSAERLYADPAAPFCMDCEVEIREQREADMRRYFSTSIITLATCVSPVHSGVTLKFRETAPWRGGQTTCCRAASRRCLAALPTAEMESIR